MVTKWMRKIRATARPATSPFKETTMLANLAPDMTIAERLFALLREKTADGPEFTREGYGAGEEVAHGLVRAEAEVYLGLELHNRPCRQPVHDPARGGPGGSSSSSAAIWTA